MPVPVPVPVPLSVPVPVFVLPVPVPVPLSVPVRLCLCRWLAKLAEHVGAVDVKGCTMVHTTAPVDGELTIAATVSQ